ncbi:hypothetical protein VHUM_03177 [Vanrija humicola]|uniref:Uncharacterized protein n=1 Tax=Vanrija humicola TaxID=5417 RepID=A0A7D8V0J5_VANHU|nr:hypothetical protein VHUM_03177 [Vanrija humicola]
MGDQISAFVLIGTQALVPIVLGSFKSLRTPLVTRRRQKKARTSRDRLLGLDEDEDDEDDEPEDDETLGLGDSLLFPVLGSAALLGLFLIIKYVDKKWIDLAFGVYFSLTGVFAVHTTLTSIVGFFLRLFKKSVPVYHVRISNGIKQIFHLPVRAHSAIIAPISVVAPAAYVPLGRPWVLSNVLALCLATAALALLKLDGFPTAFLLLGLLLAYDVFWVFYTPVMVTVAKGIEGPIKLVAPKDSTGKAFAMLGLGDVVIPGLLIALCLRFDLARYAARNKDKDITRHSSFPKPYFLTALFSWIAGLVATIYAMSISGKAQPALLYLSPACTLGPVLLALARGELALLWSWREEEKDEAERDETIEAPSEVAMLARKEAKAAAAAAEAEAEDEAKPEPEAPVDDSWMESTTDDAPKPRKRKGGKKK